MKLNITEELVERVKCAAENGSKVAQVLIEEFRRGKNDVSLITPANSKANFFKSKRSVYNTGSYKRMEILISCCNKDVENDHFPDKGNPNAPFFKENRTDLNPSSFAKCFTKIQEMIANGELNSDDILFFDSAIRLNSKVTLKLSGTMADIEYAYDEANYLGYADTTSSCLHGSCMRYNSGTNDQSRNAADFYANFAGAKILMAYDNEKNIVGRAIVWENAKSISIEGNISFIDRMYFSFEFVRVMMKEWAAQNVMLMKAKNDFSSQREFILFKEITNKDGVTALKGTKQLFRLYVEVPAVKWHKKGAPYCDSLCYIYTNPTESKLYLANTDNVSGYLPSGTVDKMLAELRSTDGYAYKKAKICPICGSVHHAYEELCSSCKTAYMQQTALGDVFVGTVKEYKGLKVPSVCFDGTRPKPSLALWVQLRKLFGL